METVTERPKRFSPRTLSDKPRCRAKSKQTQKPCANFPLLNKTLCKFHGGPTEKVSAEHRITHNGTRKYFHVDEIPSILDLYETLQTKEGRQQALIRGAAVTEHRASKIPDLSENIEVYVKARGSIRGDIALLEDMQAEAAIPQLPVFNIAVGDAGQLAPFQARTLEGNATMRLLDGEPFMKVNGDWLRAVKRIDEASGAEFYERVLELDAPKG